MPRKGKEGYEDLESTALSLRRRRRRRYPYKERFRKRVTPARSRIPRVRKEIITDIEEKGSYIDMLVNKDRFITTFVDSGYLYLVIIS